MNMLSSSIGLILITLLMPILMSTTKPIKPTNFPHFTTSTIKHAFFLSLIPIY